MSPILAAPTFLAALHERRKNTQLVDAALECVARIAVDPDAPGLNVESLFTTRGQSVFSARIDRQFRLIFASPLPDRIVLLHIDNHDEAYDWADAVRDRLSALIAKAAEWNGVVQRGAPTAMPNLDRDDLIAVRDAPVLRSMLDRGLLGYLTYLSPEQRHLVEFDFRRRSGLMFVKGGAGTGKTAIGIHRLLYLARSPEFERNRLLYLCFNKLLAEIVEKAVHSVGRDDATDRIDVATFHGWSGGYLHNGGHRVDTRENYQGWMQAQVFRCIAQQNLGADLGGLAPADVVDEILNLIKPWGIASEDEYVTLERTGRPWSVKVAQRKAIWRVVETVRPDATAVYDVGDVPAVAAARLADDKAFQPYRYLVVDEAQDCTPAMAQLAREIVGGDDRRLMILADPNQSIYANGFHIARRAFSPRGAQNVVLRIPYRSTQRIHEFAADLFVHPSAEERETLDLHDSPRVGELPVLRIEADQQMLDAALVSSIRAAAAREPELPVLRETVVLTTSSRTRSHILQLLTEAEVPAVLLDREHADLDASAVKVATVHAAKGLEFPNVYVFDPTTKDDTQAAFRNLMYVAFTRSSHSLTVLVTADRAGSLLRSLPRESYSLEGAASDLF